MAFKSYVYEADNGTDSYLIKLKTDQATVAGAVVGSTTQDFHVKVSESQRSYGVHPRFISLTREEGAAQDGTGKIHTTRLAICTKAAFDAFVKNQQVSISSISFKVAGKTGEKLR
jgi:hypothetical protein